MKPETLKKISGNKYYVEDNCIYKKSAKKKEEDKKICNFYIKELTINYHNDKEISFTIMLDPEEGNKEEITIPICYMNDPSGWLYCYFDSYYFRSISHKDEFNRSINEIIHMMEDSGYCKNKDIEMGWYLEYRYHYDSPIREVHFLEFDDLGILNYNNETEKPINYIKEYSKLTESKISKILFSYTLLSLLSSFDLLGVNIRPDFVIVLSGNKEPNRRKTALFFTNLYKRNLAFGKNEYKMFHIMDTDSFAQMKSKASFAKDCVLLAFEPDKRRLDFLVNDLYGVRSIDEKMPIRNMCLITTSELEKTEGNIVNINLPDDYSFENVSAYFNIDDPFECKDDMLLKNIYYYVYILENKLLKNQFYIKDEYKKFKDIFDAVINIQELHEGQYEAALLLSFAYNLYMNEYSDQLKLKDRVYLRNDIHEITAIVRDSYLIKGQSTNNTFDMATKMCNAIDTYFKSESNKKRIKKVGEDKTDIGVKLWWDDDCIYIRPDDIKDILKTQQHKGNLDKKIKIIFAERNIIKKYTKGDGKPEYSVHLPKSSGVDKKTAALRYIAFNREQCKLYNLFPNIEETLFNRCQNIKILKK